MCFTGVADEEPTVNESRKPCRFWKLGTCWRGARCKWLHEGPAGIAGNAHLASRHGRGRKKTRSQSHELKAMLLELLSGIATDLDCSTFSVLTKICGRWQLSQKFLNPTQSSVAVVPVGSRNSNMSRECADGTAVRTETAHHEQSGPICEPAMSSVHPILDPDQGLRPLVVSKLKPIWFLVRLTWTFSLVKTLCCRNILFK